MAEEVPQLDPTIPDAAPPVAPAPPVVSLTDLTSAIRGAISEVIPGLVQRVAPEPQVPQSPIDLLNDGQKKHLEEMAISDPAGYGLAMAELGARHAELRFQQASRPFADTNARLLVSDFRNRMQQAESPEDFRAISPEFDKEMQGLNITPIVNMSEESRAAELILRWNAAKGKVLSSRLAAERSRRPDPLLTPPGSSVGGPKGPNTDRPLWLQRMAATYKLTEEQLKEIEG